MKAKENIISEEKLIQIIFLSRVANGSELMPTYDPSEEEVEDVCPALRLLNDRVLNNLPTKISNSAGGIN